MLRSGRIESRKGQQAKAQTEYITTETNRQRGTYHEQEILQERQQPLEQSMEQGRGSPRQRGLLHRREVHTGKEAINRSADEQNPLSRGSVLETPVVRSRLDYKPDAVFVPDAPLRHPR